MPRTKFIGLPGQTKEAPPENSSLRVFYSTLFEEKGFESKMATQWMLTHGLFPEKVARRLVSDAGDKQGPKDLLTDVWNMKQLQACLPKLTSDDPPKKRFSFRPKKPILALPEENPAPAKRRSFRPKIVTR